MFNANQRVFSATHGEGVVMTEIVSAHMNYPVLVEFDSGVIEEYTCDGRLFISATQPDLVVIPGE